LFKQIVLTQVKYIDNIVILEKNLWLFRIYTIVNLTLRKTNSKPIGACCQLVGYQGSSGRYYW